MAEAKKLIETRKSNARLLYDPRFIGIEPFKKIWLSSPTMHGEEQLWVDEAIQTNWVSTVGENIIVVEHRVAEKVGRKYAVALSSGTAALHLAIKICGEKLYGQAPVGHRIRIEMTDKSVALEVEP